jgi:hypothetical protein
MANGDSHRRRGRPKKFHRPSRSLSLTLPNDVIAALQAVDPDLSRAIVRVVQTTAPGSFRAKPELNTFGSRAVISVPSTRILESQIGVELVPMAEGRALVSFDEGLSIADLELRIGDVLDDPQLEDDDRATFAALGDMLRRARRNETIAVRSRRIIVLEYQASQSLERSPAPVE